MVDDLQRLNALLESGCAVVLMANGMYAIYNPSVYQYGSPEGKFHTQRDAIDSIIDERSRG